jgi:hypothetical protein
LGFEHSGLWIKRISGKDFWFQGLRVWDSKIEGFGFNRLSAKDFWFQGSRVWDSKIEGFGFNRLSAKDFRFVGVGDAWCVGSLSADHVTNKGGFIFVCHVTHKVQEFGFRV